MRAVGGVAVVVVPFDVGAVGQKRAPPVAFALPVTEVRETATETYAEPAPLTVEVAVLSTRAGAPERTRLKRFYPPRPPTRPFYLPKVRRNPPTPSDFVPITRQ